MDLKIISQRSIRMSQTRSIKELQKALKASGKKDDDKITHTRIGDKDNNIFGGKYVVAGDDEAEWYGAIYKEVLCGTTMEYLTEKQYTDGPIYVDLDLHYNPEVTSRQHDDEWIDNIVYEYVEIIKGVCDLQGGEQMSVYVMQKDGVNRLADKTKDGLHILFGVLLPRAVHKIIRKRMIDSAQWLLEKLPLKNDADAVFDEGITKGGTNIQVYGCRKPAHEPYKLYKSWKCELDPADKAWMMVPEPAGQISPELFWELSVRNLNRPAFPLSEATKREIDPLATLKAKRQSTIVSVDWESADDLDRIFQCFNPARIDKYDSWSQIGWALLNSVGKDASKHWIARLNDYCPQRCSATKKSEAVDWLDKQEPQENGVTIKSLHYWAKEDNPVMYAELFPRQRKQLVEAGCDELLRDALDGGEEYKIAKYLQALCDGKFVCLDKKDKIFYNFTKDKLWRKDKGGTRVREFISNEIYEGFQAKAKEKWEEFHSIPDDDETKDLRAQLKKEAERITFLSSKLLRTGDKNNVLTEASDLLINDEFLKDMNKEQYRLPLKGGKILNMQTLEVTDRTIANKFDYECDVVYKALSEEETADAQEYFSSLFCGHLDTMQVVLNIIKSVMVGRPLRYIYFITGGGRNGKSVLLNLMRAIFKRGVDIISKDVILKKRSNTHLNTEMEKLNQCRLGYTTEFKEEDELNETNIKAITGKDAINVRGICRTDETLETTSNLACITNELPQFKVEQAIVDRIIVIPFHNRFEVVDGFEDKIIAKRDVLFSYIMKQGVIQDKFELTPEMRAATDDYKTANDKDYLKEYLETECVRTTELNNGKPYRVDKKAFRQGWLSWLAANAYSDPKREAKQVTRRMTKLGIESSQSGTTHYYINLKLKEVDDESDDEM